MKKLVAVLAVLMLLAVSCSTHTRDLTAPKSMASGTPDHTGDGGGGDGGGPPPAMTFDASASGSTVSVSLDNFNASGAFGYQFTFTLSGGLALASGTSSITAGSWVNGGIFVATQNPDGSYTVVGARLVGQGDCAHAGGVLANIATTGHGTLTLVGSPNGAVTPSPDLQDCSNNPLAVSYGTASVSL